MTQFYIVLPASIADLKHFDVNVYLWLRLPFEYKPLIELLLQDAP